MWRRQINVSKKPSFVAFLILKSGHDSGIRTRDLKAFRVRTKAPPVAGSSRGICWQLRAVPRGQSGRKALWARARARARSFYNHGKHPLTKSAERRVSAAPRTMQARLVSRRCAPARRWLSADRCGRGAALARGRRGTPVRRSRSCAPRSGRDGLGRLGAGLCIHICMRICDGGRVRASVAGLRFVAPKNAAIWRFACYAFSNFRLSAAGPRRASRRRNQLPRRLRHDD